MHHHPSSKDTYLNRTSTEEHDCYIGLYDCRYAEAVMTGRTYFHTTERKCHCYIPLMEALEYCMSGVRPAELYVR